MTKLNLAKETLRALAPEESAAVAGAMFYTYKFGACEPSGVIACIPPSERVTVCCPIA